MAAADGAPGFELLVQDIAKEFGNADVKPIPVVMDDYNSDWDSIYPFSAVSGVLLYSWIFTVYIDLPLVLVSLQDTLDS